MFYDVYKQLCLAKGVSESRVATDVGFSKSMVNRWKQGGMPTNATVLKLAEYFGVEPSVLVNGQPEEQNKNTAERIRPAVRVLMRASEGATDEQILAVAEMLERIANANN